MTSIDWTICSVYLVLVVGLGWWSARGQNSNTEYFVGDRKMNWLAIGISLFATTFSANSFVGLPRESAYEDYHLFAAILFIPLVAAPIVAWLFIPLYHRLRLISAYEYVELRFNRPLRLLCSALACLYALGWMGSMLYATGLILQTVLGLSQLQFVFALVGLGIFTTIYTSLGGFKAVVWTDVSQAVVLFGGMLLVLGLAVARIDGGWGEVWRIGREHGRLEMFEINFDLTDRANFFSACAYGLFVYVAAQSTSQAAVQRYVSMPSVSAARWSLAVNGVLVAVVCFVFFLVGSALFAFYQQHPASRADHDAVASVVDRQSSGLPAKEAADRAFPELRKKDQLTPHFIQSELQYPGLMGLLLAGLFAAVMNSLDSSANSITTLIVCDWLPRGRELSVASSKVLCGVIGLMAIGAALAVPYLGENVFDILITIAGAFFGPMMGLFALGMFTRRANSAGAVVGFIAGVYGLLIARVAGISPWWYGAFTCVPTFAAGWYASWLFAPPKRKQVADLTVFRGRDNRQTGLKDVADA